jgi:hypothetical protein
MRGKNGGPAAERPPWTRETLPHLAPLLLTPGTDPSALPEPPDLRVHEPMQFSSAPPDFSSTPSQSSNPPLTSFDSLEAAPTSRHQQPG